MICFLLLESIPHRQLGRSSNKQLDLKFAVKVSDSWLKTLGFREQLLDRSVDLLMRYFAVYSYSYAFSELALPTLALLKVRCGLDLFLTARGCVLCDLCFPVSAVAFLMTVAGIASIESLSDPSSPWLSECSAHAQNNSVGPSKTFGPAGRQSPRRVLVGAFSNNLRHPLCVVPATESERERG